MNLNHFQKKAIEFIKGPCLVLAGAGSGKTKVITNKIIYLINNCNYNPNYILAITFTNKASQEMKERIKILLKNKNIKNILISTFHSFGYKIISSEYKYLNMKKKFIVLDKQEQLSIIKKISYKYTKNNKKLLNKLIYKISYWKNNLLSFNEVENYISSDEEIIFNEFYKQYENYLLISNFLDFDDLIYKPTKLFINNNIILKKWQNNIKYLLVDEYQDTNHSQYQLIKQIIKNNCYFTVVGDDNQSIYSWRGAEPKNIILLKKDFPNLTTIKLEQNYRSSQCILNAANNLISNNNNKFNKKLFSNLGYGNPIKIIISKNEEDEAEQVIKKIKFQNYLYKTNFMDYTILYRNNFQSSVFEKILLKYNIPYYINGGKSFFILSEIKDIIAYLRVLINPNDNLAFLRIINTPNRKIGIKTISILEKLSLKHNISLFDTIFHVDLKYNLKKRGLNSLKIFGSWLYILHKKAKKNLLSAINILINNINYKKWIYNINKNKYIADKKNNNINKFFLWIKEILIQSKSNKIITLEKILINFTLNNTLPYINNNNLNKVTLMTLHSSKGLEFPYVFIVGMEEGIIPHQNSIKNNNIEEERRLTYVGITRAKKELTLTFCKKRFYFNKNLKVKPSRFLFEINKTDVLLDRIY